MTEKFNTVPKKIANFEIVREIGYGGMGNVYLARQMPVGREVALKVLPVRNAEDPEYVEAMQRFDSEAKAISLLDHDNIVTLYDYGIADNMSFLAMQYINGNSLFDIIQKHKSIPIDMIAEYAKHICRGLNYAHAKGVVHRDIKPQNILVSKENGKCHITDFGIAKIKRQERITMVGMAVGTPEYMSPEQAEGKNLDLQTDVYSFGILLYELCTGNPPFHGGDPVSIAYRQVHEEPKKPSKHRHDIPLRLENVIMKALKKNKNERYRGMHEILKDIDVLIAESQENLDINLTNSMKSGTGFIQRQAVERREGDRRHGDRRAVSVFDVETNRKSSFLRFFYRHIIFIIVGLLVVMGFSFVAIITLLLMLITR